MRGRRRVRSGRFLLQPGAERAPRRARCGGAVLRNRLAGRSRRNRRVPPRIEGKGVMIITRTPMRISIGGGGTDLPSYYRQFGGFVISAAINKFAYITINRSFRDGYPRKYSDLEDGKTYKEVPHPLFREGLLLHARKGVTK